jgi:hypothetical protein
MESVILKVGELYLSSNKLIVLSFYLILDPGSCIIYKIIFIDNDEPT